MHDTIGAMHEVRRGLWAKTNIYEQGDKLHAVTYAVVAGQPEVFHVTVDLATIRRSVERYHDKMHGHKGPEVGKFGDWFKGAVRTIGRSKIIRGIGKGLKKVVRSKITGGVLAAASFIPGVAVATGPALAAYGAANVALDRAGKAKRAAKAIKKLGSKAKRVSRSKTSVSKMYARIRRGALVVSAARRGGVFKRLKSGSYKVNRRKLSKLSSKTRRSMSRTLSNAEKAKKNFARFRKLRAKSRRVTRVLKKPNALQKIAMLRKTNPKAFANLQRIAAAKRKRASDIAAYRKLAALRKNPETLAKLRELASASEEQKRKLRAIAARARNPSNRAKQIEAIKAMSVLRIVAKNRAKLRAIASASRGGAPGLLIDNRGRVTRGKFSKRSSKAHEVNELLYTGSGAVEAGHFSRISGESDAVVGECIPMPVRVAGRSGLAEEFFVPNAKVGCDDNPACNC